jgi:hypothetical protein
VDERRDRPNPRISRASAKLQEASRELSDAFDAYATKFSDFPHFNEESIRTVLAPAASSTSVSGEAFGNAVEELLKSKTSPSQKEGIAHKVGDYMSKMFPLANVALGLASTGADVCQDPLSPYFKRPDILLRWRDLVLCQALRMGCP